VRGLGDIPVLGNLFKYRTRTRNKTNLMVFLRPVVVRSKDASNSIAMDRYEFMRAAGAAGRPEASPLLRDLGAPLLPPLVGGQPPAGGGMATLPVQAPPPANAAPGASNDGAANRPGASRSSSANPASNAAETAPGAASGTVSGAPVPASQFRPVTPPSRE
jgi:general secretion pathway protein D